jgi:hypothetical protein
LTLVYDGANLISYLNGRPTQQDSLTGVFADVAVTIKFPYHETVFAGIYDDIRIYSRALTAAEIALLYADHDNVTADTKYARFSRGKDSQLGGIAQTGTAELRLRNLVGKYTPENATGPLYGYLLPRRPVWIYAEVKGESTVRNLFYGYIENLTVHPYYTEKDVYINAVDGFDYLARQELETALWKSTLSGTVVDNILTAAGWSAGKRSLDAGQTVIPYAYWHQEMSLGALREIEKSELGFVYIDGAGNFVFEDRHHRYKSPHLTSQATFANSMQKITYDYCAKDIYNIIRATITPWELQSLSEIWRYRETPGIPEGGTIEIWADFDYFVDAITTPVATTDYTANSNEDGSGTDLTASVVITMTSFAQSALLSIKNNAAVMAYITLLKLRGTWYDAKTQTTRKAEDTTSQTAYQKRTYTIDGKYLTSANVAQDFCDYLLSKWKDPQSEINIDLVNKNDTLWQKIITLNISDRVTVTHTALGVDDDFFINRMEHEITEGGRLHRVTWGLSLADAETYWCLDTSLLDTGTRLAY